MKNKTVTKPADGPESRRDVEKIFEHAHAAVMSLFQCMYGLDVQDPLYSVARKARDLASSVLDTVTRENVLGDASTEPLKNKYRYAAKHLFGDEGTCEVDDDAEVSYTTPTRAGAYVQVWMYVSEEDMEGEQPMTMSPSEYVRSQEGK